MLPWRDKPILRRIISKRSQLFSNRSKYWMITVHLCTNGIKAKRMTKNMDHKYSWISFFWKLLIRRKLVRIMETMEKLRVDSARVKFGSNHWREIRETEGSRNRDSRGYVTFSRVGSSDLSALSHKDKKSGLECEIFFDKSLDLLLTSIFCVTRYDRASLANVRRTLISNIKILLATIIITILWWTFDR